MLSKKNYVQNSVALFISICCILGFIIVVFKILPSAHTVADLMEKNPGVSFGGGLRNILFQIKLPSQVNGVERLNIAKDGSASRIILVPGKEPIFGASVVLPNELWSSIKGLQDAWCTEIPHASQTTANDKYVVTFDCYDIASATIYLPEGQLPSDIRRIIEYVPPIRQ